VITGEYRIGDIRHNYADTKRSREVLKFEPSISLDQGLQRFAKWVLQQPTLDNEYEKSLRELRTLGLLQG
jgi:dTDP-L-rhamnose 4-epimerase